MKPTGKLIIVPLALFIFCWTIPLASAAEQGTPKQILKATPGKVKEGVKQFEYGLKRGKPERKAEREKAKKDIKRQNPMKHPDKK